MNKKQNSGLTLIELVVVIVILGLLVLLAVAYYRSQIFKANDARRKGDINRIQVAVEEYEKDHSCYPPPQLLTCKPGTGLQPYIETLPCDPITKASYVYDYDTSSGCAKWYRIYTNLEVLSDPSAVSRGGPGGAFNYNASSPNAPPWQYTQTGGYYGCKGGTCVSLLWDSTRPGPECDPNYSDPNCYGRCNSSEVCIAWK